MKIIFKYEDGDYELFDGDEKEAKYWFKRRMEKTCKFVDEAYMFDPIIIDVEAWKREYEAEQCRNEKSQRDEQDKREYERLRKRFEK